MKKIGSFRFFFKLIPLKQKYLILITYPQLIHLENLFKVNLGITHKNKKRPCIFWKEANQSKEFFKLVFLTASKKTSIFVNLNLCHEKSIKCKKFSFYNNSYVFQTPDKKFFSVKIKDTNLVSEFIYCGACENLEYLETLSFIDF